MSSPRSVYHFNSAIVREPSRSVVDGLRAGEHASPTYEGVKAEHNDYIAALREAGVRVTILPALEAFPDSIFVEDPALVFTEGAILLRPGAASRVGEPAAIAPALRDMFDTVLDLPGQGYVDGGDVLTTPKEVMIGLSARTDKAGAEALALCIDKLGRKAKLVATPEGVLHFKTDCSLLDEETVLSTARLARSGVFKDFKQIIIPEGEEAAANALRVNDILMVPAEHPRTLDMLDRLGYRIVAMKTAEIGRIDAGLSCLSLRWYREGE
ncbi:arginine deiminase family protein [Rhizobium sp. BR 362]|uniref:arginine deiminase family protein n=1 Tax=Rhizobium sp. BR 362 TaxID=3040670 RepID=UPI002F41C6F6